MEHTVRRNYSKSCTKESNRLFNGSVALRLVQAVAARLVERAEGVRVKACDVVLAAERVVLEDFVGSVHGAATDDTESVRSSVMWSSMGGSGCTDWVLRPFEVKASSQTSSHQTGEVLVSIRFNHKVSAVYHFQPKHHQERAHPQTDPSQ